MRRISVADYTGENAVTREQARPIFDVLNPTLVGGGSVTLDFEGVNVLCGPFCNVLFGQLYRDLASEQLREQLTIDNMRPWMVRTVNLVCETARTYYGRETT